MRIALLLEGDKSDVEMFKDTIYSLNGVDPYDDVKLTTVEDHEPAEPLIKDEKIRKAVRAWAEALDLRWFKRCGSVNAHTSRLYGQDANGTGYTMELAPNDLYGNSISKKGYTIAELCGEDEE